MDPITAFRWVIGIAGAVAMAFLANMAVDAIRAPIKAERDKAEESAKEWKAAQEAQLRATLFLSDTIRARDTRERTIDQRLGGIEHALANLKDPKARAQRDEPLHPELLQESAYRKADGAAVPSGPGSLAAGGTAAGPASGSDGGRRAGAEEPRAGATGQGERPPAGRGEEVSLIDKLTRWLK